MTLNQAKEELCSRIMNWEAKETKGIFVQSGNEVWCMTIRQNANGEYEVYQW